MSTDYLNFDEVAGMYGEEVARRLARRTPLVALDGGPAWERERIEEQVEMLLREEGGEP